MKFLYSILLVTSLFSMEDRVYMSVGNFPSNVKAVCFNGELYAQETEGFNISLNKLYKMREGVEAPITCDEGKLLLENNK